MSAFFIAWAAVTGWLVASRWLYRRWRRAGAFRAMDKECSHGYMAIHKGAACHGYGEVPAAVTVMIAMGAAAILPAVLAVLWIMHDTPASPQQVRERIAALEHAPVKEME